jgi:formylglycine-generating enzyme
MKKCLFLSVFLISYCFAHAQSLTKPEMVLVEGGVFTMGSNNEGTDEIPRHSVSLSSYSISKYEITVAQYRAFCKSTGRQMPEPPDWGWNEKNPIVKVNYYDACNY